MTRSRILIVEDDAILTAHMEESLINLGYEVAGLAATGEDAVRLALERKPDAIIMDIRLRGEMTGIEAAEEIRKTADIPIVYLTAYTDEILLQHAKLTEAYAYLAKPVRERELRASLEMAIYKHTSESRIAHLNQVLDAVRNVNRLITREHDAQRLLEDACHSLVRTRGYALVWIGKVETEGKRILPVASAGPGQGFLDDIHVTWDDSENGRGAVGAAVRLGRPVVFRDLTADPNYAPWRDRAIKEGFVASAALPMLIAGRLFGVLTVYADTAAVFDEEEVGLLDEMAGDSAFALKSIEGEGDRRRMEEALRTSEAQLSNAAKIAHLAPWEHDVAKDAFTFTDLFYEMMGTTAEREGGYTMPGARYAQRFIHPEDAALVAKEIRKGTEMPDHTFHGYMEHRIVYADGKVGYVAVRYFPVKDDHGRPLRAFGVMQDITERRRAEEELRSGYQKIQRAVAGAIKALGLMAETRDPYTSGHQQRVAELAVGIAREMGLPDDQIETLRVAGPPRHRQGFGPLRDPEQAHHA